MRESALGHSASQGHGNIRTQITLFPVDRPFPLFLSLSLSHTHTRTSQPPKAKQSSAISQSLSSAFFLPASPRLLFLLGHTKPSPSVPPPPSPPSHSQAFKILGIQYILLPISGGPMAFLLSDPLRCRPKSSCCAWARVFL